MISIKRWHDARTFLDRAGDRLAKEEVRYALVLGICGHLVEEPHTYGPEDPWFATLEEDGVLRGAAVRTPPFKVLLAAFSGEFPGIVQHLVREVSSTFGRIPGVVAEPEIADLFAEAWCAAQGATIKSTMQQRIYRLEKVKPLTLSSGRMRRASQEDKELVARWAVSFQEDIFGEADTSRISEATAKRVDMGDIFLWEDFEPVSMAAKGRPTEQVISISLVYTPPDMRRRGYATSCVACLCEELLRSGFRYCTLYTDLSNPTSNSIYKKIGFTEVCDSVDHTFEYTPLADNRRAEAW